MHSIQRIHEEPVEKLDSKAEEFKKRKEAEE